MLVSGGVVVDLGDTTNSNTTGLGSSTGGNVLTGYSGTGSNFAIDDENTVSQPNVLAENDNFGKVSSSNEAFIGTVIHDHADDASLSTVVYTPAADATTQPSVVYVSGSFAGDALGSDPDGAGPATSYGYDAFPDIADAIAAVATGGTVIVEAGTYTGPADITKNLTLEGNGSNPVIQATTGITSQFTTSQADYAVVYVAPGVAATIENLTVDGNHDGAPYGDGFYGVAFYDASGTMSNVTVENVEQDPFNGVQGGVGVLADNTDGVSRTVDLTGDTITTYQKNGTVFEGAGLTVNMTGSTVTGAGTTGVIAQNGIEVARGAVADITGNTVTGNSYSDNTTAVGTGILLYTAGAGSSVSGNTVTGNDVGVYAISDAGNTTISGNNISGGAVDGIASDGNEVTITGNNIHDNAGDGIDLYDAENGSTVENNFIENNAYDGVYIDGSVTDTAAPLLVKGNDISGNAAAGLEDGLAAAVNADFNYWGSATGPAAANNPDGTGDAIVLGSGAGALSFAPWLTSGTDTDPGTPGFQPSNASAFGVYGNSTATEGQPYTINFTPSMDITSYTVTYGDGTTVSYPAGTTSATHTFTEFGTYNVSSTAVTTVGTSSSNTQVVVVGSGSITASADNIAAVEGSPFTGTVGSFTDSAGPASNPADLSAVIHWGDGATSTATITETTPTSGVFTVSGTHAYAEYGTDTTYFVVTEAGATSPVTSSTATATVAAATISPTATNITATEGIGFNGSVGSFTDTAGSYSNPADLSAVITWGDGATSAATLVETTPTSGVFAVEGTHTYAEYGTYAVSYVVTEAGASAPFASNTASATVGAASITATATNITATEGTAFNGPVGSFTDAAGADAKAGDLSAVITWGDGATSTATLVETTPTSGTFTVDGTHTYSEDGSFGLSYVVTEAGATSTFTSTTATATVGASAYNVSANNVIATEGTALTNQVFGTITDSAGAFTNSSDLATTVSFGDGATATATLVATATPGVYNVVASHTYAEYGTYTTTVTVDQTGGADESASATASVSAATFSLTAKNISASGGTTLTNDSVGTLVDGAGTYSNSSDLSAVIDWGDGSATTTATLVESVTNPGTFDVEGTHTYGVHGVYTITITATERPGTVESATSTATVTDVAPSGLSLSVNPSTINEDGSTALSGSFTAPGTDTHTVTISYGDGTPNVVLSLAAGVDSFTNTHTYASSISTNTNYTINVTVTNVAPTVNALANVNVSQGAEFSEMGSFTDPGNDAPWQVYVNYNYNASTNPGQGTLLQSSASKSFTLGTTYNTPGTYTVLVTVVDDQGASGTGTFTVTVAAAGFAVTSFTPNPSGFDVTFNRALNTTALNLYSGLSGTYGAADLTVTGPNGVVHGSFIYDPTTDTGHFVATGGVLPVGSYSAMLVGSTSAFQDANGNPLQSNDGTGNYDASFTISSVNDVVSAPDFARGPGQTVNLPATGTTGIPISISSGAGVTSVDFDLTYNASDLTITGVTLPAALQADGFAVVTNGSTPGNLNVSIYGTTAMPSGLQTLLYLTASVPSTAVYGNGATLQISALRINEGAIAGTADEAVEKVAFIGDASGNKGYSAYDSSLIANVVVGNASGFDAFPLIDPVIIGDVTGDGTLSGQDASLVAQESIGDSVPQIPAIPAGTTTTAPASGLDPTVTIGTIPLANPGTTITIPVSISDTTGLLGANFSIGFNVSQLQFVSATVGTADGNFSVYTNASNTNGTLQLGLADNSTALGAGAGTIAYLTFTVPGTAPTGTNPVTLAGSDGGLNEGALPLTPVNGSVTIARTSVGGGTVFYNGSTKYDVKANANVGSLADFSAVATDKTALLPGGTASFANYTSYSLGLNGILIDFVSMAPGATFTAGDFVFTVGNSNSVSTWAAAPAPVSVTTLTGPNGDTYADIIWANNAIQNQYLSVTVLADADTQLQSAYTFYYGNAIGETGNSGTDAKVDGIDVAGTQANQTGIGSASITSDYDFNRDGKVNGVDVAIAQSHQSGINPLRLITVPANPSATVNGVTAVPPVTAYVPVSPVGGPVASPVQLPVVATAVPASPFSNAGASLSKTVVTTVAGLSSAKAVAVPVPAPVVVPAVKLFSGTQITNLFDSLEGTDPLDSDLA